MMNILAICIIVLAVAYFFWFVFEKFIENSMVRMIINAVVIVLSVVVLIISIKYKYNGGYNTEGKVGSISNTQEIR